MFENTIIRRALHGQRCNSTQMTVSLWFVAKNKTPISPNFSCICL